MNSISRISESSTIAENAYKDFQTMLSHMGEISKLSDLELVEETESLIGLDYKTASYKRMLLNELIRRYEKAANIKRPEEEFTEPTPEELAEIERIDAEIEAEKDKVIYWVVRFGNSTFYPQHYKDLPSLPAATKFASREEAEETAESLVEAFVVEVTP